MKDQLIRYLKENFSQNAMVFLPHFQTKKVEKKGEVETRPLPDLLITKAVIPKAKEPIKPKIAPIVLEKPKVEQVKQPSSKMALILKEVAPQLFLHKEVPRDDLAKQIKTQFQLPKYPVFYTKSLEPHRVFLENIAAALNSITGSSRLIDIEPLEKHNLFQEGPFTFIFAPDVVIFSSPDLIAHFKEVPATKKKWLGKVPLFLLSDLNLYKKDHNLKRSLWLELKACMQQSY
ncbi:MAG: hypothetical protein FJZ56_06245 [Chlamydiae bacterium]|nr:hypothetical protein [Chlamydiota bacterium]